MIINQSDLCYLNVLIILENSEVFNESVFSDTNYIELILRDSSYNLSKS